MPYKESRKIIMHFREASGVGKLLALDAYAFATYRFDKLRRPSLH